jgi:hypothetical protein
MRYILAMNIQQLTSDEAAVQLANRILDSYRRVVGQPLIDQNDSLSCKQSAGLLYELPAVVLSHDGASDPTFTFANLAAQRLFEYSWDEFLTLRSRQSAEPDQRSAQAGYISDYRGVRISASGRRFEIKDAIIWNVSDKAGNAVGQAAVFDQWNMLPE